MFCLLHFKSLKRCHLDGLVDKNGEPGSADLGKIVNLMQYVLWHWLVTVDLNHCLEEIPILLRRGFGSSLGSAQHPSELRSHYIFYIGVYLYPYS